MVKLSGGAKTPFSDRNYNEAIIWIEDQTKHVWKYRFIQLWEMIKGWKNLRIKFVFPIAISKKHVILITVENEDEKEIPF